MFRAKSAASQRDEKKFPCAKSTPRKVDHIFLLTGVRLGTKPPSVSRFMFIEDSSDCVHQCTFVRCMTARNSPERAQWPDTATRSFATWYLYSAAKFFVWRASRLVRARTTLASKIPENLLCSKAELTLANITSRDLKVRGRSSRAMAGRLINFGNVNCATNASIAIKEDNVPHLFDVCVLIRSLQPFRTLLKGATSTSPEIARHSPRKFGGKPPPPPRHIRLTPSASSHKLVHVAWEFSLICGHNGGRRKVGKARNNYN